MAPLADCYGKVHILASRVSWAVGPTPQPRFTGILLSSIVLRFLPAEQKDPT